MLTMSQPRKTNKVPRRDGLVDGLEAARRRPTSLAAEAEALVVVPSEPNSARRIRSTTTRT